MIPIVVPWRAMRRDRRIAPGLALALTLLLAPLLGACTGAEKTPPPPGATVFITSDDLGDLYAIDPATGNATLVLEVHTGARPVKIGPIGGMVYDPAHTRVLAATNSLSMCPGAVYGIDPATGDATLLDEGSLCGKASGLMSDPAGMARRAADGLIVAIEPWDGNLTYNIDPTTGLADWLGTGNATLANCYTGLGLTFSDNVPYFSGDDTLCLLDLVDPGLSSDYGSLNYAGFPTALSFPSMVAMDTNTDGTIYGILQNSGGEEYLVTVTIQASSADVTWVATLNGTKFDGLLVLSAGMVGP